MARTLTGTRCDMQTLKTWAAEHIAFELGLLRECPYHGEPLRSQQPRSDFGATPGALLGSERCGSGALGRTPVVPPVHMFGYVAAGALRHAIVTAYRSAPPVTDSDKREA